MTHDHAQALLNQVWGAPLEPAWAKLLANRGLSL